MEQVRTFVAIELDEEIAQGLAEAQRILKEKSTTGTVRWVNPEGIHLTLKFLGNVPADRIEEIGQAIKKACLGFAPFSLTFAGLGCFPSTNSPRVIWVGVQGDTEVLARLQGAIETNLAALGFPPEERPFSAHLTLGRVGKRTRSAARRRLGGTIQATEIGEVGAMEVGAISLMRSDLKPTGAVYRRLLAVELSGKELEGSEGSDGTSSDLSAFQDREGRC